MDKTMAFRKSILPPGTILDIEYESLVREPEVHIRQIIAHVDLPWEASCLDFLVHKQAVQPASVWQVRQALYQSSIHRRLPYAGHLEELDRPLSPVLDENDRGRLREAGVNAGAAGWWRRLVNK